MSNENSRIIELTRDEISKVAGGTIKDILYSDIGIVSGVMLGIIGLLFLHACIFTTAYGVPATPDWD